MLGDLDRLEVGQRIAVQRENVQVQFGLQQFDRVLAVAERQVEDGLSIFWFQNFEDL